MAFWNCIVDSPLMIRDPPRNGKAKQGVAVYKYTLGWELSGHTAVCTGVRIVSDITNMQYGPQCQRLGEYLINANVCAKVYRWRSYDITVDV